MQTDCRKIKQKINWPQVTGDAGVCRAQLIGVRVLSNLLSMHRWARGLSADTRKPQSETKRGREKREKKKEMRGCEMCMEKSRCLWKGKKSEEGAEKEKRQKSRQKDRELLFIYLFLHSPPPFFFSKKRQSSPEALLRPGLHIWGVTNARGPINNGWPSSLQQMGPTASAPAPPLQEALGGAAAQSKQPHREKWSSRK